MNNVLLLGCGNIGALYDFNTDHIHTYARAFSILQNWNVTLFDTDVQTLTRVADRYKYKVVTDPDRLNLGDFDLVCIATPTDTHGAYLKNALQKKVPLILCEKPIAYHKTELQEILEAYENGGSKVLVNYIRRFQPTYKLLKAKLISVLKSQQVKGICLNYKRGLLNNASHALDTIQFLLDGRLRFDRPIIHSEEYDIFRDDPTLSCTLEQDQYKVDIFGHPYAEYEVFDFTINFEKTSFVFYNGGNDITEKTNAMPPGQSSITCHYTEAVNNYMISVIRYAEDILLKPTLEDNFKESLQLNDDLLSIIKQNK